MFVYVWIYTFGTRDNRTALILALLDHAVLTDRFRERTHSQIAHEHLVVARAVQAWFVGQDAVALAVVIVVVVATERRGI